MHTCTWPFIERRNVERRNRRLATLGKLAIALLLALVAAAFLTGCAVAPGSDPILVHAEQGQQAAHAAVKLFLTVEKENEAMVKAQWPDIHAAAESIRRRYPGIVHGIQRAEDLYRSTGAQVDGDALSNQQALLEGIAGEARDLLAQLNQRKGPRANASSTANASRRRTGDEIRHRFNCRGDPPESADDPGRVEPMEGRC